MKIVKEKITIAELEELAKIMHGNLVKAMVDVEKGILAVDAPMHSDLFELLEREEKSEPKNLWGINLHPDKTGDDFIEFDSMMNFKPGLGNKSKYVENPELRNKIKTIVEEWIKL